MSVGILNKCRILRVGGIVSMVILLTLQIEAQSFWFGPKGGISLASQRWVNFQPNFLFAYNGDVFIESFDEDYKSTVYASLGYHTRGSSIRTFTWLGESIGQQGFKFNNIVLELGAKRSLFETKNISPYYTIGLRAEYTVNTNLDVYERFNSAYYPTDAFVNNWIGGASLGGGFEWKDYHEQMMPFIEFSLMQDFTNQYYQPQLNNIVDQRPGNFGNLITLNETAIRNLTFEVKVGIKFLRKVIYI